MAPINHYHKCEQCGNEWGHELDSPDYQAAHTCSECGTEQYYVSRFESDEDRRVWSQKQALTMLIDMLMDK